MNARPQKTKVETNMTAVTAYLIVSLEDRRSCESEGTHTQYQSDPWVVIAISAVAPLTVLPLCLRALLPIANRYVWMLDGDRRYGCIVKVGRNDVDDGWVRKGEEG